MRVNQALSRNPCSFVCTFFLIYQQNINLAMLPLGDPARLCCTCQRPLLHTVTRERAMRAQKAANEFSAFLLVYDKAGLKKRVADLRDAPAL